MSLDHRRRPAGAPPHPHLLRHGFLRPRWGVNAADTSAFRHDSQKLLSGASLHRPADIVVFLQESQFNPAPWPVARRRCVRSMLFRRARTPSPAGRCRCTPSVAAPGSRSSRSRPACRTAFRAGRRVRAVQRRTGHAPILRAFIEGRWLPHGGAVPDARRHDEWPCRLCRLWLRRLPTTRPSRASAVAWDTPDALIHAAARKRAGGRAPARSAGVPVRADDLQPRRAWRADGPCAARAHRRHRGPSARPTRPRAWPITCGAPGSSNAS